MACGSGTAQQHAESVDSAHKMEAAEIAIKVACYLPRDEINGHELGAVLLFVSDLGLRATAEQLPCLVRLL
jgi:hypothetical protein